MTENVITTDKKVLDEMTHDELIARVLFLEGTLAKQAQEKLFVETCLKSAENEVHSVEDELASRLQRHHDDLEAVIGALNIAASVLRSGDNSRSLVEFLRELTAQRWENVRDSHNWLYVQPSPKMREDWRIPF